ncbi:hypothetical protein QBC32DRAFT_372686 [Pseudoneurospora amorphoporcata]|uniref:Uncharacterized protein n=1 Tax=Pseudoneurospora amorphoporcata TaxID=241081 RepID=A0AAN6NTE8_9PEZI|nr:hypothetical protein QBC32DRAFT_372686 [Pseudoneurospora amorphoporcata]
MEIPTVLESRENNLLPRLTQFLSRSIRTATASLSLTKRRANANQTPAFDFAPTTITPRDYHQLLVLPRDSAPLSSTALLGAVLGSIGGVILLLLICCFFYIRFRAWSNASMAASSRQKRWRRVYYYHDSSSSSSRSGTSSTSSSSTSTSTGTIPRDVEMGETWYAHGAGVAGAGAGQRGYGYGHGQGNLYGQGGVYEQSQAHRGYGVGFEGGATAGGKAGPGNIATGYGPGVAQAPRVPPVAVATTRWNPHVFRQGKT